MSQQVVFPADFWGSSYGTITVTDAAIGVDPGKIGTGGIFLTLETGQIRFRFDGTDPSSTEGHLLEVGQTLTLLNIRSVRQLKMIRTGLTSGVAKVTHLSY